MGICQRNPCHCINPAKRPFYPCNEFLAKPTGRGIGSPYAKGRPGKKLECATNDWNLLNEKRSLFGGIWSPPCNCEKEREKLIPQNALILQELTPKAGNFRLFPFSFLSIYIPYCIESFGYLQALAKLVAGRFCFQLIAITLLANSVLSIEYYWPP